MSQTFGQGFLQPSRSCTWTGGDAGVAALLKELHDPRVMRRDNSAIEKGPGAAAKELTLG